MKRGFLTFGLFTFTQLLLWIVSGDDIATGGELFSITLFISLFMGIYFAGYNWARWVAVVLIGIFAMIIGSLVFEGFDVRYLAIPLLYVSVIFMLFMRQPKANAKRVIIPDPTVIDVIDMSESFTSQKPPIKDGFYVGEEIYKYPLLIKRYQSLLIDWVLLFSILVVAMVVIGESEWRQIVMISLAGIFLLAYEPILTTYSATIGQRMMGIRVRDMKDPKKRINIFQAYIRIVVKWLLWWLSFVTINFNAEHRAIHDIAGASVVIKIK